MECIAGVVRELEDERSNLTQWAAEVFDTVIRLLDQYQRCQEITNDRLQTACMATWTAQVLFEANRLRNSLAILTDEATAQWFEQQFVGCFNVEYPEYPPDAVKRI